MAARIKPRPRQPQAMGKGAERGMVGVNGYCEAGQGRGNQAAICLNSVIYRIYAWLRFLLKRFPGK